VGFDAVLIIAGLTEQGWLWFYGERIGDIPRTRFPRKNITTILGAFRKKEYTYTEEAHNSTCRYFRLAITGQRLHYSFTTPASVVNSVRM
jgi:hypothetical protein